VTARLGRSSPWVTLVGVIAILLGLLWDARQHRLDPALAQREGAFGLSSLPHDLLALGIALAVIGSLMFLVGRAASARPTAGWRRALLAAASVGLFGLATLGLLATAGSRPAQAGQMSDSHAHDHGGSANVEPATETERDAAAKLLADSKAGAARFADLSTAQAEGYVEANLMGIRTPPSWPAHFTSRAYVADGRLLDPARPESLMYMQLRDGRRLLIGVMYVAPGGQGPRVGGPLTTWHTHPGACFGLDGRSVGVANAQGQCPSGTIRPLRQPEMLHVWFFNHPDGPFADHLTPGAVLTALRELG
jgi:hypothetical protein